MPDYIEQHWTPERIAAAEVRLRADDRGRRRIAAAAAGSVTLAIYLVMVDQILRQSLGLTHQDLADHTWRTALEEGAAPRQAIADALAAEGLTGLLA